VVDAYAGYDAALAMDGRSTAYCLAHARRKFDELVKANASAVAAQAIQRIAWLYRVEADARELTPEQRLQMRQQRSRPLWEELHLWLQLERTRVPDGSAIAKAIDYSLKHWTGLGRFLLDADVPIDNNYVENRIRPWALGRRNANPAFMRSCGWWPRGSPLNSLSVTSRPRSGLHIRTSASCRGNPTSGDRHGCVRFHSPRASGVAARQRLGTVRAGLLVPLDRATLRSDHGSCVPLRRGALRALVAASSA